MSNPLGNDLDHIMDRTRDLWERLRGKRIFVTGGTGFFGCWLLESFCWANDQFDLGASATVLTRNAQAFVSKAPHLAEHPAITLHVGDVRSYDFPAGEFTFIIHLAAEARAQLNAEKSLATLETIVEGTKRTLEFARRCGTAEFLLTSSGAVYGKQPPALPHIPEDYNGAPEPLELSSGYGEGKRLAEYLCALFSKHYGLKAKIARCFAFVGPYLPLDTHFAVGNFIRDGLRGGPIHVKGDGTPFRSYLYAADLAVWLWTILFRGQPCRPYNVGSDQEITINELANAVADCFPSRPSIQIDLPAAPGKTVERYVPSVQRSRTELGLRQDFDLRPSILRSIAWHSR
jgi:dTDP-glucose 4,6-dehydratase